MCERFLKMFNMPGYYTHAVSALLMFMYIQLHEFKCNCLFGLKKTKRFAKLFERMHNVHRARSSATNIYYQKYCVKTFVDIFTRDVILCQKYLIVD